MKTKYSWLIALLLLPFVGQAQQVAQFSQYLQNPYIINPAASGLQDYIDINLSYRKQWAGIKDAPQTYYVSANKAFGKPRSKPVEHSSVRISRPDRYPSNGRKSYHAVGGYLLSDEFGLFKRTHLNLTYAFHLPVTKKYSVSFGTNTGLSNIVFNSGGVNLDDPDDATYNGFIAQGTSSSNMFDINFGTWIYSDEFFFGYSTAQLLGNEISFGDVTGGSKLNVHHQFLTGYRYQYNRDLALIPSILFKYSDPGPGAFDLNIKGDYQDRFWAGLSYRHKAAVVVMFGAHFNDLIRLGYSFDLPTSNLISHQAGSHEIVLGIKLDSLEEMINF